MAEQNNKPAYETPFERRYCYDCRYLRGFMHPGCVDEEAQQYRGTDLPEAIHCTFWEPHYGKLSSEDKKKIEERGFRKPARLKRFCQTLEAKLLL